MICDKDWVRNCGTSHLHDGFSLNFVFFFPQLFVNRMTIDSLANGVAEHTNLNDEPGKLQKPRIVLKFGGQSHL